MSMNNNVNIEKKETAASAEKIDKIVICDDDKDIVRALQIYLSNRNYELLCAYTGREALDFVKKGDVSLVLLDIMMPEMDGITALRAIREKSNVPVILITAKSEDADKVLGLDVGADDYITKPFNILEVKARIKAIMRRTTGGTKKEVPSAVIEKGDLRLDCDSRRLFILGKEINLTGREFELLELLVKNENKVYSREKLLEIVWGKDYPGDVRTVDVHVRRLREKVESNPSEPKYIHTKWGVGYFYSQK